MTLSLATRGYLCFRCPDRVCPPYGPGPTISGIVEIKPAIDASAHVRDPGPSISGAVVPAPQIDASASQADPPAAGSPKIVGAEDQKPDIDKSRS